MPIKQAKIALQTFLILIFLSLPLLFGAASRPLPVEPSIEKQELRSNYWKNHKLLGAKKKTRDIWLLSLYISFALLLIFAFLAFPLGIANASIWLWGSAIAIWLLHYLSLAALLIFYTGADESLGALAFILGMILIEATSVVLLLVQLFTVGLGLSLFWPIFIPAFIFFLFLYTWLELRNYE